MKIHIAVTITFTLMVSASALAAPPFAPVNDSFEGTRFRGIGLGQSRDEVEGALAANGFRCLTAEEYPYDVLATEGYTACHIAAADFVVDALGRFGVQVQAQTEQLLGIPFFAVTFHNDVASAITLVPDYFNAAGTSPLSFAQSIVENYPIPDGLTSYGVGWHGTSSNDEYIRIHTFSQGRTAVLIVTAATSAAMPTFD